MTSARGETVVWVMADADLAPSLPVREQAQRLALLLLSRARGRAVAAGDLRRTPQGKPFLPGGPWFSVAHADDALAVAVGEAGEVGVDIERQGPWMPTSETMRQVWGHPLPVPTIPAFYRCWTRTEALLKAVGVGWREPLDPHLAAAALHGEGDGAWSVPAWGDRGALALIDLALPTAHAAAVAIATPLPPQALRVRLCRCRFAAAAAGPWAAALAVHPLAELPTPLAAARA